MPQMNDIEYKKSHTIKNNCIQRAKTILKTMQLSRIRHDSIMEVCNTRDCNWYLLTLSDHIHRYRKIQFQDRS